MQQQRHAHAGHALPVRAAVQIALARGRIRPHQHQRRVVGVERAGVDIAVRHAVGRRIRVEPIQHLETVDATDDGVRAPAVHATVFAAQFAFAIGALGHIENAPAPLRLRLRGAHAEARAVEHGTVASLLLAGAVIAQGQHVAAMQGAGQRAADALAVLAQAVRVEPRDIRAVVRGMSDGRGAPVPVHIRRLAHGADDGVERIAAIVVQARAGGLVAIAAAGRQQHATGGQHQ